MTAPRQILPGATYLLTRRCLERRFFLKPSPRTNATFRYLLAASAAKHGILLHAYCVLSNHVHLVLTDPDGHLPAFKRDLDGMVARAVNAQLGRRDYFWERGSYNAVTLEDHAAVVEKIVYVLANPVAAGLVRRASEWPGLWSGPAPARGGAERIERPAWFFRETGPLPGEAPLQLHLPPGFASASEFLAVVTPLLRDAEDRAAATLGAAGRSFLGAARVQAQHPDAHPPPEDPRPRLRPRFASRDPALRMLAIERLRRFLQGHAEALDDWRAGQRSVVFPAGTYLMRVVHSAVCAPCAQSC
jgi:REP-associated tyrosine transposase